MAGARWNSTIRARLLVDSDLRQLEFLQKEIDVLDAELARAVMPAIPRNC